MNLVFHSGAHFTEEDRLMTCLLHNRQAFQAKGVSVPDPERYRKPLRQTLTAMSRGEAEEEARGALFDTIFQADPSDRVLLSNAHLFGVPRAALRKGLLYPNAPQRMAHLVGLFPGHDLELFMAIRNPATFLPLCFERSSRDTLSDFLDGIDSRALRWSDTLLRIREAAPEVPITVWCNEDAPLVWARVLRDMAGLDHRAPVEGSYDLLCDIMSEEGAARFTGYIREKPELSENQVRRVMTAFLEKYALDEAVDEIIDVAGWGPELVFEMTEIYDEDVFTIGRIPGVRVISP
ncbi:MAG: hypothetical protein AAF999_05990 [Pseudomonadota bacterium]